MSVKFGTSGLRGLAVDLLGKTTQIYVSAFAEYLLNTGRAQIGSNVFVGMDLRVSSKAIVQMAMQALHGAGLAPVFCGTVPTPALAYYAMKCGSASLMVTGSHIPADRNGIKFYRPDGEIDKVDEAAIVARAAKIAEQPKGIEITSHRFENRKAEVGAQFLARNKIILPAQALSGLRVAVYQHSTVARDMLVEVLEHYGAEVTGLGRSKTFIPVDTEAISEETLELLKFWASTSNYDAFVSADGDGDRPLIADETGKPLRGDIAGLLTAEFLGASTIVTPVTSNSSIEREVAASVVRTRVGSPYVIAGMKEAIDQVSKGVIGFEANGGVLTASDFNVAGGTLTALPTRDCFLPILALLDFCKAKGKLMSQALAERKFSSADAGRLENYPSEKASSFLNHLSASPHNLVAFLKDMGKVASVNAVDGLRITLTNGDIIHFRASGNAPELRCYTEACSARAARNLLNQGLSAATEFT